MAIAVPDFRYISMTDLKVRAPLFQLDAGFSVLFVYLPSRQFADFSQSASAGGIRSYSFVFLSCR
jgi:hypothetical protein